MRPLAAAATAVGMIAAVVLAGAGLFAPIEVRHSAPFGFRLTFDAPRGIAVRGGVVIANYPNFNRLDLDLRAYRVDADYDLTVHVRPDRPGAGDVRTVALSLPGTRIRHDKPAFADPFVTVRFPPLPDSSGQRYYVWIEPGPRNRDDVVALWSIKSYSRSTGAQVLAAFLRNPPGDIAITLVQGVLVGLLLALVAAFGWVMAALTALALSGTGAPLRTSAGFLPVARGRWYTLGSSARRVPRRVVMFWARRPSVPAIGSCREPVDARQRSQGRD